MTSLRNKLKKFEDFIDELESEDFLDNSIKGKKGNPNSYKDLTAIKLKDEEKIKKNKEKKLNVLPSSDDELGINTKDASLWFKDDY